MFFFSSSSIQPKVPSESSSLTESEISNQLVLLIDQLEETKRARIKKQMSQLLKKFKNDVEAEMKRLQDNLGKTINSDYSTPAHSEVILNTKMKDLMSTEKVSVQYDTDDCSNQVWMSLKHKKNDSASK